MHGKNNFTKKVNKIRRRSAKKPLSPGAFPNYVEIGNWRIAEDEEGSLLIYNFETGNKIIMARK